MIAAPETGFSAFPDSFYFVSTAMSLPGQASDRLGAHGPRTARKIGHEPVVSWPGVQMRRERSTEVTADLLQIRRT
ncbi:MAG: hypothetical protein GDA38_12290 [Hormoscilla sp. SP12CHS1]|nr:hypothetical protein [Hormoscilla sp. SP12CHS1]